MKRPLLKWRVILPILIALLIAGGVVMWASLPGLISSRLTAALHDAGFKRASVESVDVYYNATHIQNIRLNGQADGPGIGEVEVYYTPHGLLSGRLGKIFIDSIALDATYAEDGLSLAGHSPTEKTGETGSNLSGLLSGIPFDELMIRSADLAVNLQGQPITINMAGRMQRGPSGGHSIQGRLRGRSENADISAKIEGAVENNGAVKLSLTIDEARLDHPLISTSRLTGWTTLDIAPGAKPGLTTEIAAGVLNFGDTELRSLTLTYTGQKGGHHFITRGKIADQGGEFVADFDALPDDGMYDVSTSVSVTDANLAGVSQISAIGGRDIHGMANLGLNTRCSSIAPFPTSPADCQTISGKAALNLSNFNIAGLLNDAIVKLDTDISRPDEGGITFSSAAGVEISLIPGETFPARELVTGFSGERLTVNLAAARSTRPHLSLLSDGRIRIGGGFSVTGRDDNAINGSVTALTITPGHALLPDLDALGLHLNASLAAIDTPPLQSEKAVLRFAGDVRLDGAEQSLALRPSECVLLKAQKLNTVLYRPENAFDACIPAIEAETGAAQPDWLKLWFEPAPDGGIAVTRTRYNGGLPSLPIDLRLNDAQGPYRISGSLPTGQISLQLDRDYSPDYVEATFTGGGQLVSSKAPFSLTGFNGTVIYRALSPDNPAQLDTKLDITRLAHGVNRRPYFMPLGLSFESTTDIEKQEMAFNASAMDTMGALVIELAGTHRLSNDSGFGTFKIYPVDFGLIAPPMQDAFPVLRNWINQATGKLTVDTALTWAKIFEETPVIDGSGTITLEDAMLETADVTAAGINARITLDDVWPLTLPPGQTLEIKAADIGIPLTDGDIRFSLTADKILDVAHFHWQLAGGIIKTDPFALPLDTLEKTIRLQASNINLTELAIMADIDGLEATGVLNGDIPVTVSPQGFDINKGLLKAAGEGVIRYNPEEVPPALAGSNQQITTVRDALKNLQYKDLSMEISGGSEGAQTIGLHISGKNPDFYGGHPVELNLNLDGDLGALIRQSLNALGYTDQIVRDTLENQSENGNAE